MIKRIVITTGDPGGIGPDIVLRAASAPRNHELLAIGCLQTMRERAALLGIPISFAPYSYQMTRAPHSGDRLPIIDLPLNTTCRAGEIDPAHAGNVLAQLTLAANMCLTSECDAMVTAPVNKASIIISGTLFSGQTEFLADLTGTQRPLMLLTAGSMKVALLTTHIPLAAVPGAVSADLLESTLCLLDSELKSRFGLAEPRITVLGLNPHAGESGKIGSEEESTINPVCQNLRDKGMDILGAVPADSAFGEAIRAKTDCYLAMFHDQGLPVIKAESFGKAVNVTLGLPIVRTSVDHGTAAELAGTNMAQADSLLEAIALAEELIQPPSPSTSP